MADESSFTMSGNLCRDPDLRYSAGAKAVCSFVIVNNHRYNSGGSWQTEETGMFMDVVVFGPMAEHCAASLSKGDRVVVYGRLKPEEWTDNEGKKRNVTKLMATDVGLSLKWHPAQAERSERTRVTKDPIYGDEPAL